MAKCISCGAENPAGEKFCSECGMRLPAESSGGVSMSSAASSGAGIEQLATYKSEAMAVLKAGPVNLMSRRKLKMLQKRLGLTDAQAQDAEKEILAEIERMKAEKQERAAEEDVGRDAERQAAESDRDDEVDDDDEADDDDVSEEDVIAYVLANECSDDGGNEDVDASEDECSDDDEVVSGDDEEDVETSSSALCSIVVKGCNKSRLDNLIIELNQFDDVPSAYDTRQMLCNPPGTLANNISHGMAKKIGAVLKKFDCDYEIVVKEQGDEDVDFIAIVDYIKSFKKSTGCDDIVLPSSSSFDKKWTNLSTVLENSFDDLSLDQDDAFAILDCTVFGSAKNGVLIDRTGIYTHNDNADFNGYFNWENFKKCGDVAKAGSYDVQIFVDDDDDPDCNIRSVGINVSGCSLSQDNTIRFFEGLLELVRGEEA